MIKVLSTFLLALLVIGCSPKEEALQNATPKLVVGESVGDITLNDQFEKPHRLSPTTKKLVFAFAKESAHTCNDFFKAQKESYLQDNKTEFIADVSPAPSLVRSLFIMPGLKDLKHTVLLLEDREQAAPYRAGIDIEKIFVLSLNKGVISKIQTATTDKELQKLIETE